MNIVRGGTYNCTNTKIKANSKQLTAVLEVLDEVVNAAQLASKLGCVHPASFRAEEVDRRLVRFNLGNIHLYSPNVPYYYERYY